MKKFILFFTFSVAMLSVAHTQCILTCNSFVNFSLDNNGQGTITADMIIEGSATGCSDLEIALFHPVWVNNQLTPWATALDVDCADIGDFVITVREVGGNGSSCWGNILIEDKLEACTPQFGPDTLVCQYIRRTSFGPLYTDVTLNGAPIEEVYDWMDIIPKSALTPGQNTLSFPPATEQFPLAGLSTLDLVHAQRFISIDDYTYPLRSVLFDLDDSGYLGVNDLFLGRQLILGMIATVPAKSNLFVPVNYEFPSDFDPFDFTDLDFRNFTFDDATVTNEDLKFYTYQMGDINEVLDSLTSGNATVRSNKKIIIEDFDMLSGQSYTVPVKIQGEGFNMFGAQLSFDFSGISIEDIRSAYGSNVLMSNEVTQNDYRIQLLDEESHNTWEFEITFTANSEGRLSDVIALNTLFNNTVANVNGEDGLEIEFVETSSVEEYMDFETLWQGDQLIVRFIEYVDGRISINSIDGKGLYMQNFGGQELVLTKDIMSSPGIYILTVESKGLVHSKKVVAF